jgi:hypothetical protein
MNENYLDNVEDNPDILFLINTSQWNGDKIMASCCDDPTESLKIDPRDLLREQERYGNLLRDLFTDNPERVMLKQLHEANVYLRELAALRAYYPSVRFHAIELLDKTSLSVLERLSNEEPESKFGIAAKKQIEQLDNDTGLLSKLFRKL